MKLKTNIIYKKYLHKQFRKCFIISSKSFVVDTKHLIKNNKNNKIIVYAKTLFKLVYSNLFYINEDELFDGFYPNFVVFVDFIFVII